MIAALQPYVPPLIAVGIIAALAAGLAWLIDRDIRRSEEDDR